MLQSFVTVRNGAVKVYGSGKPLTDWEAEASTLAYPVKGKGK
jgi:hypothetical protein